MSIAKVNSSSFSLTSNQTKVLIISLMWYLQYDSDKFYLRERFLLHLKHEKERKRGYCSRPTLDGRPTAGVQKPIHCIYMKCLMSECVCPVSQTLPVRSLFRTRNVCSWTQATEWKLFQDLAVQADIVPISLFYVWMWYLSPEMFFLRFSYYSSQMFTWTQGWTD